MSIQDNLPHKARIAFFDIETSPNLVYTWGLHEQEVIKVVRDWVILSFSVKYLGEKKVRSYCLADFPGYNKNKLNDYPLVKKLWEEFNNADILVAHNGDRFDVRKATTRFMIHGMSVPAPYKTIDTKKMAKSQAAFDSNKLDELCRQLELDRKMKTGGFWLWEACMDGDKDAWKTMKKYNSQDVLLLEELYLKLRPWAKTHPAVGVYEERVFACPRCGSDHLQRRGWTYTSTSKRMRYQCRDCFAWSSGSSERLGVLLR